MAQKPYTPFVLNPVQQAVLAVYADGKFNHLKNAKSLHNLDLLGDNLLSFILTALKQPTNHDQVVTPRIPTHQRTESTDLVIAIQALRKINHAISERVSRGRLH